MTEQITNLGQAVNVLIQVATLAQSKGILSLAEAVIVKESIDFINAVQEQNAQDSNKDLNKDPNKYPKAYNKSEDGLVAKSV